MELVRLINGSPTAEQAQLLNKFVKLIPSPYLPPTLQRLQKTLSEKLFSGEFADKLKDFRT